MITEKKVGLSEFKVDRGVGTSCNTVDDINPALPIIIRNIPQIPAV